MDKNKNLVVHGVTINAEDERVKEAKSVEDIQKLFIFSHLDEQQKAAAEQELWEKLQESRGEESGEEEGVTPPSPEE